MIETLKRHWNNDIRQLRAAWDDMDTLSHVLVIMFITLLFMSIDMLANRIHF